MNAIVITTEPSESSNLHARRMCNVHFQRAMDVRVESKRVAKPADIFVVAQSQMRGGVDSGSNPVHECTCTCSAATDFKITDSSVKR